MRVLFITNLFPPRKSGAPLDFYYLSEILEKNKNITEILVLTNRMDDAVLYSGKGRVKILRILRGLNVNDTLFRFAWNFWVIRFILEKYEPRLVFFYSSVLPFGDCYGELFNHADSAKIYLLKTDMTPVRDFGNLSGVIWVAENIRKKLLECGFPQEKMIYLPLLFKPPKIKNTIPGKGKKKHILYVGNVSANKGVFELIRAFNLLKNEFADMKLILIGHYQKGVFYDNDIIFLGEQEREIVCAYIKNAEIVILPSYSEGLPRAALETLYLQRPFLITDGLAAEFAHLHPSQKLDKIEPEEIAAKISRILKGGPWTCEYPWGDLEFASSAMSWNNFIEEAAANPPENKTAVDDNRFFLPEMRTLKNKRHIRHLLNLNAFKATFDQILDSYRGLTDLTDGREFSPGGPITLLPVLEENYYIDTVKNSTADNIEEKIDKVLASGDLGLSEKKSLVTAMILKSETDSRYILPGDSASGILSKFRPLTGNDFLFFGSYYFRKGQMDISKEFFLESLDYLPENIHLNALSMLLNKLENHLTGKDVERLKGLLENLIGRLTKEELVLLLFSGGLEFSDKGNSLFEQIVFKDFRDGEFAGILKSISRGRRGNVFSQGTGKMLKVAGVLFNAGLPEECLVYIKHLVHSPLASDRQKVQAFFLHGDILKKRPGGNWKNYYNKALKIVEGNPPEKGVDVYRVASAYKRMGNHGRAKKWFGRLLQTIETELLPGVFFHLGEMCFLEKEYETAGTHFRDCIRLNPAHSKSREYLRRIRRLRGSRGMEKSKPLLFYCGHHKCGSIWIRSIVQAVCEFLGLEYFNARGQQKYGYDLKAFTEANPFEVIALANARYPHLKEIESKKAFHVVRDPRDICVSAYYSHLYSHSIVGLEDARLRLRDCSGDEGLLFVMEGRKEQFEVMEDWDYSHPDILELKFETLIQKDAFQHFRRAFHFLGLSGDGEHRLPDAVLAGILERNSFKHKSGGRPPGQEDIRNHFRKGIAGDWKNHFKQQHIDYFKAHYNPLLLKLGYEKDEDWGL